jgi:hypothetical protein
MRRLGARVRRLAPAMAMIAVTAFAGVPAWAAG